MKRNLRNLAVAVAATTVLAPAGIAMANGHHGHGHQKALWASPTGTGTACTFAAPCSLTTAVSTATSGQTVHALKGTYTGGVTVGANKIGVPIATPINLIGEHGAVIDATGDTFGIGIVGTASGTTVRGFTVENAIDTGIIVVPGSVSTAPAPTPAVTDITIRDNRLTNNGATATSTFPGGWGIHLMSATGSTVANNWVSNNGGGIYLTDEFGPNAHNKVLGNHVKDNVLQCGIILAGHSAAVDPITLKPTGAAGVFDNLVKHNVVIGNGTSSQGGGILMGGGALDAAVYSNVIADNVAIGNGLAGVVIHQHAPGDLNNNVIVDNLLIHNNVGGDPDYPGFDIATKTANIVVANASPTPITGTVIVHNRLKNAYYGIWTLNAPGALNTIVHNRFAKSITVPIKAN